MAKTHYRIPTSIARSFLDHEIVIGANGWNLPSLPMKVILFWAGSILLLFWAVSGTFIKSSSFWAQAFFVVFWIIVTAFFGRSSKTKEMPFVQVAAFANYVQPGARRVSTRRSSDPSALHSIVQIDSIDEGGLIRWSDGTVGQGYLVVGSASVLLFDQDRESILDRVDAFWRKVEPSHEFIWITTQEPQRVWRQLSALERLNQRLEVRDPELFELMEERFDILKDFVGGQFDSTHQYLVIKGDDFDALRRGHRILESEAENSGLMIRQCSMLDSTDVLEMFKTVYATSR